MAGDLRGSFWKIAVAFWIFADNEWKGGVLVFAKKKYL
jgi:hypothetical protein